MNVTTQQYGELFDGGPPRRVQNSLGLIKPDELRIARRARLAVLVGWVPLVLLAAVEGLVLRNPQARSLFSDFAVHARFLVAVPLFILAEADCIPRLRQVARHFLDAGLISETDRARFDAAVASNQRLLKSGTVELIVWILVYGLVSALMIYIPPEQFPAWHRSGSGHLPFSLARWWHTLVSLPLLLVLLFGWLWRVFLWSRFLWLMARLDLRLIPGHPDHAGGLMFLSTSLRAFWLLSLAIGTIVAGTVANRVVHDRTSLVNFTNIAIGLVVVVLILFAGPLVLFIRKLYVVKFRGIFEYGALAGDVGRQFERKWLNSAGDIEQGALEVPDFSATTDLYQIVANVYDMKYLILDLKNLGVLVAVALLPFVPVVLTVIPLKEIIKDVAKLLLFGVGPIATW